MLSDNDLVDEAVCMANRPGSDPGWILVGVEDDGTVSGARPRHGARTDPVRVQAVVANNTIPSLACRAELVPYESAEVLVLEISAATTPVGTRSGVYKRRAIGGRGVPECLPFHFHEMQARIADRGALDYSAVVVPDARWDDLDPLELERYRRAIRESRGRGDAALLDLPDLELAKALGAVEANHDVQRVRVLGLLLFGQEDALSRLLPTHEVAFQVSDGTRVVVNDFFRWPLLRVMEELLQRFRARNREQEVLVGLMRVGVPDYSEPAFREAVANAFIHRDFTRLGAAHVQWHPDRIEISNPGGFPEGVRIENLLVTPPRPRNPLLAEGFKRAGLVERTARGVDTIFVEQLRNGRPAPSYERSSPTDVVLVLPGGDPSLEFVRLVSEEAQAGRPLGLDELLLLNTLRLERQLSTGAAAALIQKPDADARAVLNGLVESGLVEPRGERKGRTYHLSASTYQRLGEEAAYVRLRGFEPLQQEQMIAQYVEKYGSISRRQAADLCRLSPDQASRLLRRMVAGGKLRRVGEKKGARYVPAA
jgi:ATP-dependent DNA helicase RecG